ncbi:MAG: hypothetical protein KDA45_01660 [Planctomycetales bacterium]|nr:hypothetical protein [Planctomycetales bacterium]
MIGPVDYAIRWAAALAWLIAAAPAWSAPPTPPLWQAVADEVYLQEIGRQIKSSQPLTSLAVFEQRLYAGGEQGLLRLDGEQLLPVEELTQPIHRLVATDNALWALTGTGLYRLTAGKWAQISSELVADVTEHQGQTIAAIGRRLWRVDGDGLLPLLEATAPFAVTRVLSHCETLYVHGPGRLTYYDGERIGGRNVYQWSSDKTWDWGQLPSKNTRDALSQGSRLYMATDRGLALLQGMSLTSIRGEHGLCYEDTTCLAKGFANDLWVGTSRGAIRMVDGDFHYFSGPRWLPHERITAIAAGERDVYLATPSGLGIVSYEEFTMQKKADYYERHMDQWGQRRLGFTHKLEWDQALGQYVREVSDNDGGYTGHYLAAQCYRYAVTKDPEARAQAVNTFQAFRWLVDMPPMPGFIARSVWAKGEVGHQADHGSGDGPAEWHDTTDGKFEWKGDTSSDEVCSHFYSTRLFLEHVAQGEEIPQAKHQLSVMARHIADNGWKLIDLDGKPTRWGRWDPEYFATEEGLYDRGLQALQVLSFMKTAEVLAGDRQAGDAYRQLLELGYPEFTLRQRNTFPPDGILHFLDGLAIWSYANLLHYEQDPLLRATYRRSLERSYEIIRIEQNPWFNFVYGTLTGNDCEVPQAVKHLREWPLDLRVWNFQNSHRTDLTTPPGYGVYKAGIRTFSPRETSPMRWDRWTMQADGGSATIPDVIEPGGWLHAYWMGRYHGFITPPTVDDPALLQVEDQPLQVLGAQPYVGPPRPAEFQSP